MNDPKRYAPLDDRELSIEIARMLGETRYIPRRAIEDTIEFYGAEFALDCLAHAAAIEESGGKFSDAVGRYKTIGGIFFKVVNEATKSARIVRPRPPPPAPPPKPTWDEAVESALNILSKKSGEARNQVKAHIVGRPGRVESRGTYVVMSMTSRGVLNLPKGLPPPPPPPAQNIVLMTLKHWNRVRLSIAANADDNIIIEGYGMFVPELKSFAIFGIKVTTMFLVRAQKELQRAAASHRATSTDANGSSGAGDRTD